uniref:Uncharacterized protein n=1 Tax=Fagus sylvatica TaxID=28930 RepID=A0A2N9EEV5_FAGSY
MIGCIEYLLQILLMNHGPFSLLNGLLLLALEPEPANLVRHVSCWQLEQEWQHDIAAVSMRLSGFRGVSGMQAIAVIYFSD